MTASKYIKSIVRDVMSAESDEVDNGPCPVFIDETKLTTSEYINSISREYSTYVMEQRAIPIITDGLKLSQRIALHLLRHQDKSVKTAGVVGRMMESGLYVHGDASAADAISRLAAPFLNNYPLIRGEGAFGTRVAPVDGIGAARYTEVLRSKIAENELYVDLDICPQRENYDGSKKMPQTFLPRVPLILLNGSTGIAVGFANKILPRKLDELREAVVDVLTTGKTTKPLLPYYERYDCEIIPDHSTRNKYYLRGRVEIKNTSTVKITELPPGMSLDAIKERLITLENDKKISSFEDNSTDHIDITVKMPRAELQGKTVDQLIVLFKLVQAETENLTVLDPTGKRVVKYNSVQDMVKDFVEWRLGLYEDRYKLLLDKETDVALFWECFLACFKGPGGGRSSVAASISSTRSKTELREAVEFAIEAQTLEVRPDIVSRIVDMPVYRFTKEGQDEAKAKLKQSQKDIKEYQSILGSPTKRKNIYKAEVVK